MLTYARWKYLIILLVVLFSALYALPNVFQKDPSVQVTASRGAAIDEGLRTRVAASLQQAGVAPLAIEIEGDNLLVPLQTPDQQVQAADALRPVLGSDYVVALNLASNVPDWLGMIGAQPMLLGLDLQAGVHSLMQVDQKAALDKRLDATTEDVRVLLRENRVRYESVARRGDNSIAITLASEADAAKARPLPSTHEPTLTQDVQESTLTLRL